MFRAGVTCSNCHEPHGLKLRADGNAVCSQCHLPQKFDVAEHHRHQSGGAGAACTGCHMPTKTYMVVDNRHDHSLRVPRPDLTIAIGVPNACNQCHTDRDAAWAAQIVAGWYPQGQQTQPHFSLALHAGRTGAADAERLLDQLVLNQAQPGIARASALLLLSRYGSPASEPALKAAIADPDALVRVAVPRVLPSTPSRAMVQAVAPMLSDPVRAVRVAAARALAGVSAQSLSPEQQRAFVTAYLELIAAEMVDSDRPETHLNLGLLHVRRQQPMEADAAYRTALRLDSTFVPAMVNLADLNRLRGMDQQGADLLRKAMQLEPDNADIRHSLGLYMVRQRNYAEAMPLLQRAAELAPDNIRYTYVYAVALNSTGSPAKAMAVLTQANRRQPANRDILLALVSIAQDSGNSAAALLYARKLAELYPGDMQARTMVLELEKQQTR
jgi:predicted CXXCH cytochrome family protein